MKKNYLLTTLLVVLSFAFAKAQNCQAGFQYYNNPSNMLVNFYDSSSSFSGNITSHAWSFGDGSSDTSANPTHVYSSFGFYLVIFIFYGYNLYNRLKLKGFSQIFLFVTSKKSFLIFLICGRKILLKNQHQN